MSTRTRRAKELPEDLVIEIMLRLPAIALLRFRCVCKSWCTLISNHDFITKHLKQSSLNEKANHLLLHRRDKTTISYLLSMLSFQTLDVLRNFPVPFIAIDRKIWGTNILASCNGVVCLEVRLEYESCLRIVLWNPTTRETKIVPNSLRLPPRSVWADTRYDRGFGFDAKTNDYKVVKFSGYSCHDYQVQVYSLRSDSWRKIDASVPVTPFYNYWDCGRLYTNGMFSWGHRDTENTDTLLSFDMSNEVFLTTPLPDATLIRTLYKQFIVKDESVALVVCIQDDARRTHCDIWVLCEYGVKESWTKLFTVGPFTGMYSPLGFWKNVQVFLRTSEGQLLLYDPVAQDINYLQLDGVPFTIQLTTYMESLVSIKGGN